MSTVIVVRRYKCWDGQEFKKLIHQEAMLQICGASDNEMLLLSQKISAFGSYKLTCNCRHCVSYSKESRVEKLVTEPMIKGVSVVFNVLAKFGYVLKSTSTTQNGDGSCTTTWVWIKIPKMTNI